MRPWAKLKAKHSADSGAQKSGSPKIELGATTHVGRVRESNEDHFRVVPELQLMIVSDGWAEKLAAKWRANWRSRRSLSIAPSRLVSPHLPLRARNAPNFQNAPIAS